MVNVAVLGSTNGTSLQMTLDAIADGTLTGVDIRCIISNRSRAGILGKAITNNIEGIFLSIKKDNGEKKTLEEYDREIDAILTERDVELVLLVGYMKLMSPWFVDRWLNRVMNIHPSLLPAFAGGMDRNVHQDVLDRGCKVSGATLMFIDHGADTGPIISQRTVVIENGETVDTLKPKVQALESQMILDALVDWHDGRIGVDGTHVTVTPLAHHATIYEAM